MSLPVLVLVVVAGITLIILAVHLSGGTKTSEFDAASVAIERFAVDFPETETVKCHLTRDRHDAILELADGHIGLVHAVGSNALTRFVAAGEMSAWQSADNASSVEIRTGDLTWPRAQFHFDDAGEAAVVSGLFGDAAWQHEERTDR
ncbi:hypothetical protein [Oricola sp.]|uniref:hypothetical protein n=1 Tax=Oricola sp. TaxID=1979950 RepID=UPI003BA93EE7